MASSSTDAHFCDICSDTFSTNPQNTVCTIPCGHFFHEDCLKKWFHTQRSQKVSTSCPDCRKETPRNQIILLYATSKSPASSSETTLVPVISSADIRRKICERSLICERALICERTRLINRNEQPEVTTSTSETTTLIMRSFTINYRDFRKVYLALAIKLLLTLSFLMLLTFHYGSKQFICEHHMVIIFTICFIFGLICWVPRSEHEIRIVGSWSFYYLSVISIGNVVYLEPCVTTLYPYQTLLLAIGLTAFTSFIVTKMAFKVESSLTSKQGVLGSSLFLLMISLIIWRLVDKETSAVSLTLESLCLLVCCCYLMMFTQFMKEDEFDRPIEYITQAMSLLVSIINMFIFTLRILGEAKVF